MHSGTEAPLEALHIRNLMGIMSDGNRVRYAAVCGHLLKLTLLILVVVLLCLYVLSLPLGLELFLFERLSDTYSPGYPVQISLFYVNTEVSLGYIFTSLLIVYALCFVLAWRKMISFRRVVKGFFSNPFSLLMRSSLFSLPILSSLTYIAVVTISFLEKFYGVPIGKPPLPEDPLLSFYGLTIPPLTEEITYRILPIGVFLMVRLLTLAKMDSLMSLKERLRICVLSFISPEDAKETLGLKIVARSGLKGGVSLDEWVMVLFTSAFFGLSHYLFSGTWLVGKIASTFIQGLVMGLSFLAYGIQAPILIHWFFDYYLYAYSLASAVHPNMVLARFVAEKSTWGLGALSLFIVVYLCFTRLVETKAFSFHAILTWTGRFKTKFSSKSNELLSRARQFDAFDLAALFLVLTVFSVRLAIVNVPAPEAGDRYYDTGFVFDESYYVKAARKMLAGEASNNEHPPLSKALFMLGIVLFGDNPVGWRIFPIIAACLSIALLYKTAFLLCRNKFASFFAALFFATDIMAFNIGQIAILDAPSMSFILLGSVLLLKKRYDLSGFFFGLASLCKLNAIFALAAMILFQVLSSSLGRKKSRKILTDQIHLAGRIIFIAFVTFLIGLWIYDAAYGAFGNNPLGHLIFMYNYHGSLRYTPEDVVLEKVILPLKWINPLNPFSPETPAAQYHVIGVTEMLSGGIVRKYHPIAYYGIYTPLWWAIWALVPISLIETARKTHRNKEQRIDLFVFVWVAANFFPYVLFGYLMQRCVYPFYFYMTLPGLYIGLSYYSVSSRLSKIYLALLIGVQSVWFIIWFPVKPKVMIDLLLSLGLPA